MPESLIPFFFFFALHASVAVTLTLYGGIVNAPGLSVQDQKGYMVYIIFFTVPFSL